MLLYAGLNSKYHSVLVLHTAKFLEMDWKFNIFLSCCLINLKSINTSVPCLILSIIKINTQKYLTKTRHDYTILLQVNTKVQK